MKTLILAEKYKIKMIRDIIRIEQWVNRNPEHIFYKFRLIVFTKTGTRYFYQSGDCLLEGNTLYTVRNIQDFGELFLREKFL